MTCLRQHGWGALCLLFTPQFSIPWTLYHHLYRAGSEFLDAEQRGRGLTHRCCFAKQAPSDLLFAGEESVSWVLPAGEFCFVYPTFINMWAECSQSGSLTHLAFWLLWI